MKAFLKDYVDTIHRHAADVTSPDFEMAVRLIAESQKKKGKVIVVGNGGSAAMAAHVAVDFTKNAGVTAITFNEADLLTCFANDYGYERWVEKALHFYARPGDAVILISSSGKSPNILNGARQAREMGLSLITLSGFHAENPLRNWGHVNFYASSQHYNVVEMSHHIWLLAMVDYLIENPGVMVETASR